jgi:hypothetical protein
MPRLGVAAWAIAKVTDSERGASAGEGPQSPAATGTSISSSDKDKPSKSEKCLRQDAAVGSPDIPDNVFPEPASLILGVVLITVQDGAGIHDRGFL